MTLVPGMTKNGKAFLTLHVNGQPVGQWSPDDARGHARGVLDSIAVIALDDGYLKVLTCGRSPGTRRTDGSTGCRRGRTMRFPLAVPLPRK